MSKVQLISNGQPCLLSLLVLGLCFTPFAQGAMLRPLAGKGPDAKTLLVYTATRTPFSLGDTLELIKLHLQRVATHLETVSVSEVSSNKIAAADYLVIFSPEPSPRLGTNFLKAVAGRKGPVLWVGFGADQLDTLPGFPWVFEVSPVAADRAASSIQYRGQTWQTPVFPWLRVSLISTSNTTLIMTLPEGDTNHAAAQPLCWQMGNFTFYAGVPLGEGIGYLFSDLLLDFYEIKEVPESRVFLRIEDYSAQSNHREFLRMVDFLSARSIPFMVGVIPAVRDSSGQVLGIGSAPEFASALRYAQQRGGRLVLHGYHHALKNETGEGHEFWDTEQDRPLAEETAAVLRDRLQTGVQQLLRHGLLPLAWETPSYAASRQIYREVAQVFSTAVERVQLSDATGAEKGVPSSLTLDSYNRLIVPENLGYVLSGESNCFDQIKANAEMLTRLRGTVAGCYIHAYQPLQKLTGLVNTLSSFKKPFLDLAELDNAVAVPGKILLTGNAQRSVKLKNAAVRWKAFDKFGKLLNEEQEPELGSAERTFHRKGRGDYELIEFTEGETK